MSENLRNVTGTVFNIQHYCIHDGPGIRTNVFVKGCPLRCLWCANPESNLARPQLMTYSAKCTGCGRCTAACGAGAISISEKDGKMAAITDRALCTECFACVPACPHEARELAGEEMTVRQVLEKVERDRLFIETSGGGMTLSGGEPYVQNEFVESF